MKLVAIDDAGAIGLLVELPAGPHVIDLANSLGALAGHDLVSGGLINGALKEKSAWGALVANWRYLRSPLARLARIAAANPDHPRLVLHPWPIAGQAGMAKGSLRSKLPMRRICGVPIRRAGSSWPDNLPNRPSSLANRMPQRSETMFRSSTSHAANDPRAPRAAPVPASIPIGGQYTECLSPASASRSQS